MTSRKVKTTQEAGFVRCLDFLLRKWRIKVPQEKLLEQMTFQFKDTEEKEKAKLFKLSLATFFSVQMDQDLPEDHNRSVCLFSKSSMRLITRILMKSNVRKLKFCFDVLQCKALAEEVPRDMILDAYRKHATILSNPISRPPEEILQEFERFIEPFLERLPSVLPDTKVAPVKAYTGFSRKRGGLNSALIPRIRDFDFRECRPRMEPTTLHIEGQPGVGKSLLYALLGKKFDKYFNEDNSIYWRSSTSDHYDGYAQQAVFGIDDAFFQSWSKSQDHNSSLELLQLISTVDFQPPMADLRNKGMRFSSPIVLLSSNKGNDYLRLLNHVVNTREAFFRRLDINCKLTRNQDRSYTLSRLCPIKESNDSEKDCIVRVQEVLEFSRISDVAEYLFSQVISEYERKRDFYMEHFFEEDDLIYQNISGSNYYYSFPKEPVAESRFVEAYAIPEPLKVRMITKGHPDTYCLKPVQLALFDTLKHFRIFEPCWEPDYKKIFLPEEGKLLVSGDYSSATDGICQDLTKIVGRRLAEKYPQLGKYILNGTADHIVRYPKGAQQDDIRQTGGQLMGSLLSFPILCLVNAFTLGFTRGQTLTELDCLIHGDDLSFSGTVEEIVKWKNFAASLGLEPSIGKNYLSDRWYTIDSKIFCDGKHLPNLKWKQLAEPGPEEIASLITSIGVKGVQYFCKETLRQSCRSLMVGINYGGLNPNNDLKPKTRLEKLISVGRCLDRIPRITKGLMSLRSLDVDSNDQIVQKSVDPIFQKRDNCTDQWYQEKKWIKYFNNTESMDSRLEFLSLQPYRLGPRVFVDLNTFNLACVKSKVLGELGLNGSGTAKLEEHSWIDFPSELRKRRAFEDS